MSAPSHSADFPSMRVIKIGAERWGISTFLANLFTLFKKSSVLTIITASNIKALHNI